MAKINLGRVLPIFLGDWDSSKTYQKLDVVLYNGSSWVATGSSVASIPASDNEDWQLCASGGSWSTFSDEEKQALADYLSLIGLKVGTGEYNNY